MYSTLHQQRVDSIIERFEENAVSGRLLKRLPPPLYTFYGTSNNTIQFCPYTEDGTNWVSYVWTNTKNAFMRDVRDIIHGLMSNGYTPFYKNVYRDVKCPSLIEWNRENNEIREIKTELMKNTGKPCTHLLAFYKVNRSRNIYFCPMYTNTYKKAYKKALLAADVRHESEHNEVKTQ